MHRFHWWTGPLLAAIILAMGLWFYHWSQRLLLCWGLSGPLGLSLLPLGFAAAALAALLIKPIPIKAAAIAVLYLLLFGLLSDGLLDILALVPAWTAALLWLRDSGLPPVLLTGAALLYAYIHGQKTVLTRYELPVYCPLPQGRLRIALVSDVHMGFSVDRHRLEAAAQELSQAEPDLLVIAGDLVDEQTSLEDMQTACRILGQVAARWGTWFVYGNHDLAQYGPRPPFTRQQLAQTLRANNISILDDSCAVISGALTLAGRHDAAISGLGQRLTLEQLLAGAEPGLPIILVDHQPLDIPQAARFGVTLQLSGHTHGGQIWPAQWLMPLLQPHSLLYGCRSIGSSYAVVSSGLGNRGSRLRSGCCAETVLIELIQTQPEGAAPS